MTGINNLKLWATTTGIQPKSVAPARKTQPQTVAKFEQHLKSAALAGAKPKAVISKKGPVVSATGSRQDVAVATRIGQAALVRPAAFGPIPSDTSNRTFADFENPIPLVVERLRAMGVDPNQVKFELRDDVIANWGGHYTNHSIHTTFPDGTSQDYSLEWTLRDPSVTAVAIAGQVRAAPASVRA